MARPPILTDSPRASPGTAPRRRLAPGERVPLLVAAALEEFAERGYGGARMAAVAARAGVAKGLAYHYFPSKEALFRATMQACLRPIFEEAEERLARSGGSAKALLRDLVGMAYQGACEQPRERALFKVIIAEAERFPELAAYYRTEVLSRVVAIVRALLQAGAESGEFRPEVATMEGLAEVVFAPATMAVVWQMILGGPECGPEASQGAPDPAALRAAHLDLLLAGLAAHPKAGLAVREGGGGVPAAAPQDRPRSDNCG